MCCDGSRICIRLHICHVVRWVGSTAKISCELEPDEKWIFETKYFESSYQERWH